MDAIKRCSKTAVVVAVVGAVAVMGGMIKVTDAVTKVCYLNDPELRQC